jgi:hypothetical protein
LFDGFSFPASLCTFSENVFLNFYFNFIFFLYDWHELGEMRQPKKLPASWFDLIQNKIKKKLKLLSALTSTHTQQSKGSRSQTSPRHWEIHFHMETAESWCVRVHQKGSMSLPRPGEPYSSAAQVGRAEKGQLIKFKGAPFRLHRKHCPSSPPFLFSSSSFIPQCTS